jgi:hypothetical protein
MGTKLGSVYFDVKGNKGDRGTEERTGSLLLLFQPVPAAVCPHGQSRNNLFAKNCTIIFKFT